MPARSIRLVRETVPGRPALDTALSRATLERVAAQLEPETLRLYRPDPIVAFGRRDAASPGYAAAVALARERGFAAVQRLAGGRAAVFHEGTLAFAWAIPDPDARLNIQRRFQELAEIMAAAFRRLGVDARIGEVPGEYCPGAHSVNARGERKLMGVGQRLIPGATHVGGVVVVEGGERVRDVLEPVYDALAFDWRPATAGSLREEKEGLDLDLAEEAILDEFGRRHDLDPGSVSDATRELADTREADHVPRV